MDEERLSEAISRMVGDLSSASGATQQLAGSLTQAGRSATASSVANAQAAQIQNQLNTTSQNLQQGFGQALSGLTGFATSLTGIVSSVYGADKAFTSVIPTVDAVAGLMSKMTNALGTATSGITILGTSLGRAPEAIARVVGLGIELTQGMIKFQLETAQKVADSFIEITKAGALFGSGITQFVTQANELGLPMTNFKNIVVANAESLAKLGTGQNQAARLVAGFAKQIVDNTQYYRPLNESLVALYGSVEALAEGTADYLALQTQLGRSATDIVKNQKDSIADYLMRQKELTAITGKNIETAKREEEARRRQLDYNLKLQRLPDVAQKNVQEAISVFGKIFGDRGARVAEEYFATGGKLYTTEAITFAETNAQAMRAIEEGLGTINQSRESFRAQMGQVLQQNAPALEGFARSMEELAEINRAANNEIIRGQVEVSSSIIQNLTLLSNYSQLLTDIEEQRRRTEAGAKDPATAAYVAATREMLNNQREIDQTIIRNMTSMGELVTKLNALQLSLINTQGSAIDAFNRLMSGTFRSESEASAWLSRLSTNIIDSIQRGYRELVGNPPMVPAGAGSATPPAVPATPANPPQSQPPAGPTERPPAAGQNPPQRAEGGLATGPTVAGEDGVEAVIPLKGGKIPLELDLSLLERPLKTQIDLVTELIEEVKNGNSITQQLLNSSY